MPRAKKEEITKEVKPLLRQKATAGETKVSARGSKATAKPTEDVAATVVEKPTRVTRSAGKSSLTVNVIDINGNVTESIALPEAIFGAKINAPLMAQAIRVYVSNEHQRQANAKTRGEVTGSTRKIYRQKGSGRARHGAITAPTFVGGGKPHGPKPKDWKLELPKKMRRQALFSALTNKLQEDNLVVVSGLGTIEPKTRVMAKVVTTVVKSGRNVLVVLPENNEAILRASRNLPHVATNNAQSLNTLDVIRANTVVLMKEAIDSLEKTFVKKEHVAGSA